MPVTIEIRTRRVDPGARNDQPLSKATSSAEVLSRVRGKDVVTDVVTTTDIQWEYIHKYVRALGLGLDTTSVEAEIDNALP